MDSPSRRQVLAIGAATVVTLPMLQSAIGSMRSASANATVNPAARGGATATVAEKAGWFTTKLKAADLKDNEFVAVEGHAIVLSRSGKTILALTNKCTHQGCAITPKAGSKTLNCSCHGAQFNLDGTVAKAPARNPLGHYAIRVNADGLVEIDPGTKPAKADDKDGSISLAAAPAAAPATAPSN